MEKKNIVLADCKAEEVQSFAKGLSSAGQYFEIRSHISNWKRTGKWSELKRYGMYFWVGFRYFLKRNTFDAIVGWQQFYALIFCFFCAVFHVAKKNTVIAANFTYKPKTGKLAGVYRWFMKKCLSDGYMDYLHVLSEEYADLISAEFDFPRKKMIVTPFGVNDRYEWFSALPAPEGMTKDGYALAIGRSNRDYDFLIRAWKTVEYPLVIISDTYGGDTDQQNINILRNVAGEESYPWIANCGLMVIPIADGSICSGDTVLLTAMSLERKIVVTVPSTLAEMYLTDKVNAMLTPKQEAEFANIVNRVLSDDSYGTLGTQARNHFLQNYTREKMGCMVADMWVQTGVNE